MASQRPQWPDILDPAFRKIYGDEIRQLPQQVFTIFNVDTSVKNIEKDSSATGLSKLVQTGESAPITYEDEVEGYNVIYTHLKFTKGTSVSQELWEDDQFGVMRRKPQNLANAKIRTQEQFGADILNGGFTLGGSGSALFTGPDSVSLFNAAHPREDGGATQSNYNTADLSEDSIENALVTMRATLDGKGQLMLVKPTHLIVPPSLEKEARILMDSMGRTGTTNNDINPYKGRLEVMTWDYLGSAAGGSDTAWFIMDRSVEELNWFNRSDRGLEGPDWDFDTKTARWSTVCRWSAGWSNWRGIYGSKGDNS
jgi:phage major head subunit gpT-like protein